MSEARENGLIVLSLDGETDIRIGVLSALYSLRDLMVQVAEGHPELTSGQPSAEPMGSPPEALPSKCFDLIVGSGDGGWVAIMLGRMGMSTSQVIDTYCQIRTSVHDSDFNIDTLSDQQKAAKSAVFEQSLRLLVAANTGRAEEQLRIGNPLCYVAALAMRAENDAPHPVLFRNYEARKSNSPNCSIWFAIRAVASSKSFPPACTTSMSHRFCFLAASQHNFSNPVDEAITEALELAKKLKITGSPPLACLVSLGAGHPGIKPLDDPIDGNVAARLTRNPEKAHEEAQKRIEKQHDLKGTEYFRLNVDQGLQENLLNDIKLEKVLSHTEAYLNTFTVTSKVSRIVEHIVGSIAKRTANSQTNALPTEDPASEFDLMHIYANRLYLLGYGLPLWEPRRMIF
ncbi:hypothetical protein DL96DRAFT_1616776 [Flagelloscypha sp. PMI_526]|nr:hypothetical protein DL96DRAFT_1616776 [Flagelloscypha sp. PMI_526]